MLKIKVITKDNEKKIFDVDSDIFENAKKRILKLYPKAKHIELMNYKIDEKKKIVSGNKEKDIV